MAMSEKFFFSLHDVDLDNDDQLHAFASRVWAQVMSARTTTYDNEPNERENEMTTTILTHRYADAVSYASDLHADQTRKSTAIPYVSHLLGVSSLVLEAGGDEDMAIAALLHDGPEDQGGQSTLDDIRARFGDRVAHIVEGCSDSLTEDPDAKAPWKERKVAYLAHLQDTDDDTRTVSMADKLHNARAIVTDLRISGPTTWDRFNSSSEEILWYYTEILDIGLARSSNAFLKTNLQATVTEMTDLNRAHREQQ